MSGHCSFCGVWHSGSCCHHARLTAAAPSAPTPYTTLTTPAPKEAVSAAPIPQGLLRYSPMLVTPHDGEPFPSTHESPWGDYVRYTDHAAALAASEARCRELEKELSAHSWPMTCASLLATHVLGHFALPTESSQVICKDWAAKTKAAIDALLPKGEGYGTPHSE